MKTEHSKTRAEDDDTCESKIKRDTTNNGENRKRQDKQAKLKRRLKQPRQHKNMIQPANST